MSKAPARAARAFGRFWWDLAIGDTPELFVATLVVVGASFALRHVRIAAVIVLPLLVAAILGASAWRGRRRPVDGDP
ncbi:MAG TPA: hypothetical protein VMU76_12420 [Acidimicrobiales bacterium]|nr:hypothetical protein [Acidimicrobiales bacterium]